MSDRNAKVNLASDASSIAFISLNTDDLTLDLKSPTQGRWRAKSIDGDGETYWFVVPDLPIPAGKQVPIASTDREADAKFIAAVHNQYVDDLAALGTIEDAMGTWRSQAEKLEMVQRDTLTDRDLWMQRAQAAQQQMLEVTHQRDYQAMQAKRAYGAVSAYCQERDEAEQHLVAMQAENRKVEEKLERVREERDSANAAVDSYVVNTRAMFDALSTMETKKVELGIVAYGLREENKRITTELRQAYELFARFHPLCNSANCHACEVLDAVAHTLGEER